MKSNYANGLYNDYEKLLVEYEKIKEDNVRLANVSKLLDKERILVGKYERELSEKDKEIDALKKEILRLNGLLNIDSNNSGIPTSQTPINKNKRIPNSRKTTNRHIGGQNGHAKSKLEAFKDEEVTDNVIHTLDKCPKCGAEPEQLDEEITKDETDYEVVIVKRRHHYPMYYCPVCKNKFHYNISPNLKEENQYGSGVKSLALLLMNTGNTSVNKVKRMIYGLSEGRINPSEGYIIKQQKILAKSLTDFLNDLRDEIIKQPIIYWDDTVICIHKNRACMRYYGNSNLALYKAHEHKNKAGIDEDKILNVLSQETTVMHDHNSVNYNESYSFNNIECNAHLLRDLQYITENIPEHTWSALLQKNIIDTNEKRNSAIEKGETSFPIEYTDKFFRELDIILLEAAVENGNEEPNYYTNKERQLINRIVNYKDNYFAWILNFDYPFTNNLSERSLRGVKSKMKISGQFQSEAYAQYYTAIKSYIETCYRNGINEYMALKRLCDGTPYSVKEILKQREPN